MKANRKFVHSDDAVSPVIAVILMVAITVVLAATVFVLVSDIGGNKSTAAPAFNMQPDESNRMLKIESAAQNADWNRLTILADACAAGGPIYVGGAPAATHVNALTPAGGIAGATDTAVSAGATCATAFTAPKATGTAGTAAKILAGDYLQFCGTAAATNVHIVVKDTTANSIAYQYTFTSIAICP